MRQSDSGVSLWSGTPLHPLSSLFSSLNAVTIFPIPILLYYLRFPSPPHHNKNKKKRDFIIKSMEKSQKCEY